MTPILQMRSLRLREESQAASQAHMVEPGFKPSLTGPIVLCCPFLRTCWGILFSHLVILLDGDGMNVRGRGRLVSCKQSSTRSWQTRLQSWLPLSVTELPPTDHLTSLGLSFLIYKMNLFNEMMSSFFFFSNIAFQVVSSYWWGVDLMNYIKLCTRVSLNHLFIHSTNVYCAFPINRGQDRMTSNVRRRPFPRGIYRVLLWSGY